jgi:hypothetical protein
VHEAAVPADLLAAVRRVGGVLGVPFAAVLLAAHARVLATLAGERDVVASWRRRVPRPGRAC